MENMTFEALTAHAEAIRKAAITLYQGDIRVRQMIDSSVHRAAEDHGEIDPEEATRDAYRIAAEACALLAAQIFAEDAEIRTLRAERDHYQKLALQGLNLTMPNIVLQPA